MHTTVALETSVKCNYSRELCGYARRILVNTVCKDILNGDFIMADMTLWLYIIRWNALINNANRSLRKNLQFGTRIRHFFSI